MKLRVLRIRRDVIEQLRKGREMSFDAFNAADDRALRSVLAVLSTILHDLQASESFLDGDSEDGRVCLCLYPRENRAHCYRGGIDAGSGSTYRKTVDGVTKTRDLQGHRMSCLQLMHEGTDARACRLLTALQIQLELLVAEMNADDVEKHSVPYRVRLILNSETDRTDIVEIGNELEI